MVKKMGTDFLAFHKNGEKFLACFAHTAKESAHYRFFDCPVIFLSNRREILEILNASFRHFVDQSQKQRNDPIIIQILGKPEREGEKDIFYLIGPDKKCFSFSERLAIFPYVSGFLMQYLFNRLQHLHVIHAAALSYQGQGFILVGDGKSGKTTLSLALMKKGFSYLSDEFAFIDPGRKQLLAFPKCLYLREDTSSFFPSLDSKRDGEGYYLYGGEKRWLLDPKKIFQGKMIEKSKPMFFIFLNPDFKSSSRLESIDQVNAFTRLVDSSWNLRYQEPETREKHLLYLLEIMNSVSCYSLYCGNPVESADLLADLVWKPGEEKKNISLLEVDEVAKEVRRRMYQKNSNSWVP